jgi:sugar phosphate isomerase/epimerase
MELCVSSWSLRDHVGREFPLADFGRVAKDRFGISAVELCQMHFVTYDFGFAFPAQETAFLDEIKTTTERDAVTIVNIPVDVGNLSQLDEQGRAFDLQVVKTWMAAAKHVGSQAVRVNTESVIARERSIKVPVSLSVAKESFEQLAQFAEEVDIQLLLENHGGLSSDPDNIIEVVEAVASEHFGLCADLGNFADDIRIEGLKKLVPYTKLVHAKTYDFDENGEIGEFDFGKCLRIFKNRGYDGPISVEFEGAGDQWNGVKQTIELIKKHWR